MHKPLTHQRGSALLAAVILIGIAGLIMAGSASVIRPMQQYFGQRNKGADMRSLSEEGLQLAIRDLLERAKNSDWTTMVQGGQQLSEQVLVNMGLVIALQTPLRTEVVPRFARSKQDGSLMKIYYVPSIENADPEGEVGEYNALYPKLFNVIVESKKSGSAQIETMEALVAVKLRTPGDFAVSFVENSLSPGAYTADDTALSPVPYTWIPSSIEGDVHLGNIHKDNFYFDASFYHPSYTVPANVYEFIGKTTIGTTTGALTSNTFSKSGSVDFSISDFEDEINIAFMDDTELKIDEWKNEVYTNLDLLLVGDDICLKFVGDEIEKWDCATNTLRPDGRYSGEFTAGSPSSTYEIPAGGLKIYVKGSVHVKGELDGNVGIFAQDYAWIEGDIQYSDQSANSNDMFSLFAVNGVRIPSTIPNEKARYFDIVSGSILTNSSNVVVSSDRDTGDTRYINPNLSGGSQNAYGSLDLDGCFMSFGDLEIMPFVLGEDKIEANNASVWDQYNSGAGDYYYYDSGGGVYLHQSNPAVCAVNETNPAACPDGQELQHNYSDAIWLYGCMSFEKPSLMMHRDGLGFQRMVIKADDRFKNYIPYGMPSFQYPKVDLVWSRRFNKKSELLQSAEDAAGEAANTGGEDSPGGGFL